MFLRYSHDGNSGFGNALTSGDPSNWPINRNWADQSIIGLTSSLTPTIVNDIRFQYNYWNNHNDQSGPGACNSPCVAGGTIPNLFGGAPLAFPNVFTFLGSNMPAIGPNFNAPQGRNTRRFELVEALSWQKGIASVQVRWRPESHQVCWSVGLLHPHVRGRILAGLRSGVIPAAFLAAFPGLPTVLHSDLDAQFLPVLNINSSIFSGVGVGKVSLPGAYDYEKNKHYDQWRMYFQDVWKIRPNSNPQLRSGVECSNRFLQLRFAEAGLPVAHFGDRFRQSRTDEEQLNRISACGRLLLEPVQEQQDRHSRRRRNLLGQHPGLLQAA